MNYSGEKQRGFALCLGGMNRRIYWVTGALFLFVAIVAEAFGAHALSDVPEQGRDNYRTATLFLMVHGVALLAIQLLMEKYGGWLLQAGTAGIAGRALLFATTVLIKVFVEDPWWGFITPIGGGVLIIGWLLFAMAGFMAPQKK